MIICKLKTDRQYPWEFSVPLNASGREVEVYVSTRTSASKQELLERIVLGH